MKKLLTLLLFVPLVAQAEFMSGNTLLQKINSTEVMDRMLALGYVMGVSDAYQNKGHCAGQQVTSGQTRDVVKLYLERNPAVRDLSADLLSLVALGEAFPCPKNQKQGGKGA